MYSSHVILYSKANDAIFLIALKNVSIMSQIKVNNEKINYLEADIHNKEAEEKRREKLKRIGNGKYVTEGSVFNDFTADGINILFNDSDGLDDYVTAKHDFSIFGGVSYVRFNEEGTKTLICASCGAQSYEKTTPLFTCLGYSAPENGIGGIAIGYTVNNNAINEYEELTGKAIKYGVFAVSQDRLGVNDVFADDGTVAEGVINAEITNYEFAAFELKIVGFTDEHKDTKFAMGAYVAVTEGKTTEYSYMQDDSLGENEKYSFVSYNDIAGKSSTDEGVTQ